MLKFNIYTSAAENLENVQAMNLTPISVDKEIEGIRHIPENFNELPILDKTSYMQRVVNESKSEGIVFISECKYFELTEKEPRNELLWELSCHYVPCFELVFIRPESSSDKDITGDVMQARLYMFDKCIEEVAVIMNISVDLLYAYVEGSCLPSTEDMLVFSRLFRIKVVR